MQWEIQLRSHFGDCMAITREATVEPCYNEMGPKIFLFGFIYSRNFYYGIFALKN
jgi:hypothetical protein